MSSEYEAAAEIRGAILAVNETLEALLVVLKEMNQEGLYANGLREKMIAELQAANAMRGGN
jgi:hypothetical protein